MEVGEEVNWDDYRYFLAVARTGRLSSAAQRLNVDHATVGRRVKSLEDSLACKLFDRSPQGYSLTDSGQQLIHTAEKMETGAIEALAKVGGQSGELTGTVRVGATEGIATHILAGCAADLCRQHPMLELQVVAVPRTLSLSKREADFAITVSAPTSGRLKHRKICDYHLHLYGTEEYLNTHPAIACIEDLKQIRGIAYVQDLIHDKELDYIPLLGPDIRPHLTSTSIQFQLEAILANGGVGIVHDFMAARHPQLKKVLPDQISFKRSYWYVVHEDYAKLERIKVVSEAMRLEIRTKIRQAEAAVSAAC